MKNKKILLVGGCGFIGHNLALHLKKKHEVFCNVDFDGVSVKLVCST